MKQEHLKITEYEDHTEIEVLRPCGVRWSVDGTIWTWLLTESPVGTVYQDFDAPKDKPRSYASVIDEQNAVVYYHRQAARAFAELMRPWWGGSG